MSTEVSRILPILDAWASGSGATVFLFGSRARGDHHDGSDVDIHVAWPAEPDERFVRWWTGENGDLWRRISAVLGARAEILDPDDRQMQAWILAAPIVATVGCARAVLMPRRKPARS